MDKPKVLVVEDDSALQRVLCDKLSQEGFLALKAGDGMEGLEVALKNHPDLILLDIVMPKMDGMEMLAKLRVDDWGKNAPVMLLTNLNDPEKMSNSLAQDVHEYLVKTDWTLENLIEEIKKKLWNSD